MNRTAALAAVLAPLCLNSAHASPSDYVFLPSIGYGEREIDFKFGTAKSNGEARDSAASLGFGWGATPWWFTELYLKYEREGSASTHFDAFEWENKFLLTEPGRYWVDVDLITELEHPQRRAEGYEFRFGPLLQTAIGRLQLNANLLFERHYDADISEHTQMGYQMQIKYRWMREFEFGMQGFGELGDWDHWSHYSEQTHRFGPAVFGKLPLGGRNAIRYNAAFLFGATPATPDHTFRLQTEWEF